MGASKFVIQDEEYFTNHEILLNFQKNPTHFLQIGSNASTKCIVPNAAKLKFLRISEAASELRNI